MSTQPAAGDMSVDIIKRKRPHSDELIFVTLPDMPVPQRSTVVPTEEVALQAPGVVSRNQVPALI